MRKQDTPGETNQHEKLHRTTRLSTAQEMTKVHTRLGVHKSGIMTDNVSASIFFLKQVSKLKTVNIST